jgi:hypothetical protein
LTNRSREVGVVRHMVVLWTHARYGGGG